MPLTQYEQPIRIPRLGGQSGRSPIGSINLGSASKSEGAFHHADFLAPAKGTKKLIAAPLPGSAYEFNGVATGILEVPAVEGYDSVWISTPGSNRGWCVAFGFRPLNAGNLSDVAATDGQIFFSTANQCGTHPRGGAAINSIRASLVVVSGNPAIRVKWGTTFHDLQLVDTGVKFDLTEWISFQLSLISGTTQSTLQFSATQPTGPTTFRIATFGPTSLSKGWLVHAFRFGGCLPDRQPSQGIQRPCHAVFTEVKLRASTNTTSVALGNQGGTWARYTLPVATATELLDIWPLDDSTTRPRSLGNHPARIVGNRVMRGTAVTPTGTGSLDCDGTGMVTIQNAELMRETPKTRAQSGVEGHYLELPARTIVMLLDPERIPWTQVSVERACFFCEATPLASNLGVTGDPVTYPDAIRPSEHLRCEIERVSTTWFLRVYFGELEPVSLKHPAGTVGGQTSTVFPPALSSAGEPPATWNKPQGDPTVAYSSLKGPAFQITLGDDSDLVHPMAYSWWVFIQRKFVAQNDAGNACSVFVRRVLNGVLDTGFGEVDDPNADASGERHPLNQSCFSATRLNGNDVNYRPDSYVMSIGADVGSQFGEENLSYDGTTRRTLAYPVDDALARIQYSDAGDRNPFRGRIASFAVLDKYLLASDRDRIAVAGAFVGPMRALFGDSVLCSMNFDEPVGNVLRDARGNDIGYAEKIGLSAIFNNPIVDQPALVGAFPRPEPLWHNEIDLFAGEYSQVNAIVQRMDSKVQDSIFVVGQPGLYSYSRTNHALTRVTTLPGQGGPGQASATVDNNDIIHLAGGTGRPIVITRENVVAISGIEPPHYTAPQSLIVADKAITGGLTITFQVQRNTNLNLLVGYEIDDTATVQFAIGYWSDALKTRSAPGGVITARYVDTAVIPPASNFLPTIIRYRLLVSGLPPPKGPNASLVTHWELYRTDSNGKVLLLEHRIPISDSAVTTLVGDTQLVNGEEADPFRGVAPEGMKAIVAFGDRLVGVAPPETPRSVVWSKRRDPMNWPAPYLANLNQTNAPAAGCIIRRGRAFPFSRDHFYQLIESTLDANLLAGQVQSIDLDPLVEGVGGISHFAAITDHDNGIYIPGNKSIYLTEGGTYRSISLENDSAGATGGTDFTWPDSWDLTDPDRFVAFHDERRRMVAICGPAKIDPNRIDALLLFYERAQIASDGRSFMAIPDCGFFAGLDVTCAAHILDPTTGNREAWLGTQLGYLVAFGEYGSIGAGYAWLDEALPKYGEVFAILSTTSLRLEGSFPGFSTTDLFRGAPLRIYRDGLLISTTRVLATVVSSSWVEVTLDAVHEARQGDHFTIGAIPLDWRSGKIDYGESLHDKRLHSIDITMNE